MFFKIQKIKSQNQKKKKNQWKTKLLTVLF